MSDAFVPARESHAIEVMAWAIELNDELTAETLKALSAHYEASAELKQALPNRRDIGALRVSFEGGSTPAPAIATTSGGVDFTRFEPDGTIAWSISIRPQFISCSCGVYDRWHTTKPEARRLLEGFVDVARAGGARIRAVGLQYQDAFYAARTSFDALQQAIRFPNTWLPSAVCAHESLWHVHQGWFSTSPSGARVLNTLNVELRSEQQKVALRIDGQHRLHVHLDGQGEPREAEVTFDGAISEWEHLHAVNRRVLDGLLTDGMLERINAQKGKY